MPPMPARMGRNKIPAPTAVPKQVNTQPLSMLFIFMMGLLGADQLMMFKQNSVRSISVQSINSSLS